MLPLIQNIAANSLYRLSIPLSINFIVRQTNGRFTGISEP